MSMSPAPAPEKGNGKRTCEEEPLALAVCWVSPPPSPDTWGGEGGLVLSNTRPLVTAARVCGALPSAGNWSQMC